jgi:hypothetical protein
MLKSLNCAVLALPRCSIKIFRQLLLMTAVLCFAGCQTETPAPKPEVAKDTKRSLGPSPDPTRDEAANLIKACGSPNSDTQQAIEQGTQRTMSWHRYGVDFQLTQNTTDSPKWATTGIFRAGSEDTIDRNALSRKMSCTRKVKLFAVDEFNQWLFSR